MAEQSTDAAMLTVIAIIRALHRSGVIPAQSVADEMDIRATNAMLRGSASEREKVVQALAVTLQTLADGIEQAHPFASRSRPLP